MQAFEKAEKEVERNRLWRAKEILQGALPVIGYAPELYEKLGAVLLRMGDLPEAGRFLFLSGVRKEEYREAIGIYLGRHSRNGPRQLYSTFPRKARLGGLSEYPEGVRRELSELGFPELFTEEVTTQAYRPAKKGSALVWITCLVIAVVMLGLMILGTARLIDMVRHE